MKTKVTFKIVIPSKSEDKKIKKLLSEINMEEMQGKPVDYKNVRYPDGSLVKYPSQARKK